MSAATIKTRVQLNPEILTENDSYLTDIITRAQGILPALLNLPRYPALAQGYSKSNTSATEDISGLSTNELFVSLNGGSDYEVNPTLANCTTGANTAAELQTQIRAVDADGFDEITVAFASTQYTITAGRYGEDSQINVTFREDEKHVAQSLKLGPLWGGTELCGGEQDDEVDILCAAVVEVLYTKAGAEGLKSGALPDGVSFTRDDWSEDIRGMMAANRRLF